MEKKFLAITLLGIFVTGSALAQPVFAATSISVSANSNEIFQTDKILITGSVSGESTYKPIRLALVAPDGTTVFNPYVEVENGEFKWVFNPPGGIYDQTGTYTLTAIHEDALLPASLQFTILSEPETEPIVSISQLINEQPVQASPVTISADLENEISTVKEPAKPVSPYILPSQGGVQASPVLNTQAPASAEIESMSVASEMDVFANSAEFATMVGVSIAAVVVGVVIWMRTSYLKEIAQR